MTNKEILQSDVLDILFENRNKLYGAYALRKGYNNRLFTAFGAGMSIIVLLAVISMLRTNTGSSTTTSLPNSPGIIIQTVEFQKDKPKNPVKPKTPAIQKPMVKIASENFNSNIKIEKNLQTPMPSVPDLDGKAIDDKHSEGKENDETVITKINPAVEAGKEAPPVKPDNSNFLPDEKEPQFPGGPEALKKFITRYLNTPGELRAGEKKTVKIKFKVDKDGTVNTFEILFSGGSDYDNEVVRVCKKMPHWIPARQNGINVPVSYMLPVTFIGTE